MSISSFINNEIFKNFDIELYKFMNADLLFKDNINYYKHYSSYGKDEKRIKSYDDFVSVYPNFDCSIYQEFNIDLKNYSKNELLRHYHNHGKNEDIISNLNEFYTKYPDFNIHIYKLFNTDIDSLNEIQTLAHYNTYGKFENRISNIHDFSIKYPFFELEFYKNMYEKNNLSDTEIINDYYKNTLLIKKINNYLIKNNISHSDKIQQVSNIDLFYKIYPDFNIDLYKIYLNKTNKNNIDYSDTEIIYIFFKSTEFYISNFKDLLNKLLITKKFKLKEVNNESVIYSINTFYKNYPLFNYNRYFKYINFNSIKNNSFEENKCELENIISAYQNIENLSKIFFEENDKNLNENFDNTNNEKEDFMLKYQEIILQNKLEIIENYTPFEKKILSDIKDLELKDNLKDIIIYTSSEFNLNNTEVTNQYYLASLLDKHGYRVRIYNNIPYIKNNIFNNYYYNDLDINNSIIIYCDKYTNILNSIYCLYWIFNEDNDLCFSQNDYVYYFNNKIIEENKKYLSFIYLNPNIKNKSIKKIRNGFSYINNLNKEYNPKIKLLHPSNSTQLKNEDNIDYCIDVFNKSVFFISYEPNSFLIFVSALCGCICIVHPIENLTKKEWLETTIMKNAKIDNVYGIAYGIGELEYAKNTISLAENQWKKIIKNNIETSFIPFMNDINKI